MAAVSLLHTSQVEPATLGAARALLAEAFDDRFGDDDWEHALGGLHALVQDGDRLIGHGAVVQRRLLHGGRALRTGYVEAVAVAADARRQGVASAIMAALEDVVRRAYDLGALSATDAGARLYEARGWRVWQGPTAALTPAGKVPTPEEDGAVHVLTGGAPLDLAGELTCDWRDGDLW